MLRHAVLALMVAAVAGHTHAREPQVHYVGAGISVWYPAAWRYSFGPTSAPVLHYGAFLWLSTQPLHDPCTTTTLPDGTSETDCATASSGLEPGGVLVEWEYLPFLRALPSRGRRVHLGGHAARLVVRRTRVVATIAVAPRQLMRMTATLVPPRLQANRGRILRMLGTLRFVSA